MTDVAATLCFEARDEAAARVLLGAVHADDDAYVRVHLDGRRLVAEVRAPDLKGLLRAADDLLACIAVAEDVMNAPSMGRPNA